jgi:hypothetical protein
MVTRLMSVEYHGGIVLYHIFTRRKKAVKQGWSRKILQPLYRTPMWLCKEANWMLPCSQRQHQNIVEVLRKTKTHDQDIKSGLAQNGFNEDVQSS